MLPELGRTGDGPSQPNRMHEVAKKGKGGRK